MEDFRLRWTLDIEFLHKIKYGKVQPPRRASVGKEWGFIHFFKLLKAILTHRGSENALEI